MNFLADENVDRQIVDRLRQDGHLVTYVAEIAPRTLDDTVMDLANQTSALLITGDKDFGELVFRQGRITAGVILPRLSGCRPRARHRSPAMRSSSMAPNSIKRSP